MKPPKWILIVVVGLGVGVPAMAGAQATSALRPERISPKQLDLFAAVVDEDARVVENRLLWDPSLAEFAAAAADARVHRRRLGTGLTVGGFATAGLGLLVGAVIWLSGISLGSDCPYEGGSNCVSSGNNEAQMDKGTTVILASTLVGLTVGFSGIAMLRGTSEAEDAAIKRYRLSDYRPRPVDPQLRSQASLGGAAGKKLNLSLLSLAF